MMSRPLAPRATRTLISWLRWPTTNAVTPYKPTTASASASARERASQRRQRTRLGELLLQPVADRA